MALIDPKRIGGTAAELSKASVEPNLTSRPNQFNEARALYDSDRFREAADILKDICKLNPNDRLAKQELTRTISRLLEQQRGFYNFRVLYSEVASLRPPCLDHATYVGAVEVRETKEMDMGMFTTKDVKAGDFLVCEKAFAYEYTDSVDKRGSGTSVALIRNINRKLTQSPGLIPLFSKIYHGNQNLAVGLNGELVIDPYLIERVITLNSFGGSLNSRTTHLRDNDFSSGHSSGIWALAARINHSCFGNCRRSFIGDMQIIRASQDMTAATELVFPYRIPPANDHDYVKTQEELKSYGFVCACPLCIDAKNTTKEILKMRQSLRLKLREVFMAGSASVHFDYNKVSTEAIESIISAISATYTSPAYLVPRTGNWDPCMALTRIYGLLERPGKFIATALLTLEQLGFLINGASDHLPNDGTFDGIIGGKIEVVKWGLMVDYVAELFLAMWTGYAKLGDTDRADQARALSSLSYRIIVGEDETFEETYGVRAREFVRKGELWRGA